MKRGIVTVSIVTVSIVSVSNGALIAATTARRSYQLIERIRHYSGL
jgi:hypothetical protein